MDTSSSKTIELSEQQMQAIARSLGYDYSWIDVTLFGAPVVVDIFNERNKSKITARYDQIYEQYDYYLTVHDSRSLTVLMLKYGIGT